MRRRRDEHLKNMKRPKKRFYSRTPGGCTTLSKSSLVVLGQIRRIIFLTSSLALSIDPFPAEKQERSCLRLTRLDFMYPCSNRLMFRALYRYRTHTKIPKYLTFRSFNVQRRSYETKKGGVEVYHSVFGQWHVHGYKTLGKE